MNQSINGISYMDDGLFVLSGVVPSILCFFFVGGVVVVVASVERATVVCLSRVITLTLMVFSTERQ